MTWNCQNKILLAQPRKFNRKTVGKKTYSFRALFEGARAEDLDGIREVWIYKSVIGTEEANCLDPEMSLDYCPKVTTTAPPTTSPPTTSPPTSTAPQSTTPVRSTTTPVQSSTAPPTTPVPSSTTPVKTTSTTQASTTTTSDPVVTTTSTPTGHTCYNLDEGQYTFKQTGMWKKWEGSSPAVYVITHQIIVPISWKTSGWRIELRYPYPHHAIKCWGDDYCIPGTRPGCQKLCVIYGPYSTVVNSFGHPRKT